MDYKVWLDQYVWVCDNRKEMRRNYLGEFQEELTKWMKKKGYEMDKEWNNKRIISKWLYAIHVVELVKKERVGGLEYPYPNHRNWPEDRDTYEVYVRSDDIEEFLLTWRTNEDFDPETRVGQRVREEILELIYIYLDLDSSKHGKKIARIMANDSDDEYDEDKQGEKDVYLVEAQEGWHGGGWQKV